MSYFLLVPKPNYRLRCMDIGFVASGIGRSLVRDYGGYPHYLTRSNVSQWAESHSDSFFLFWHRRQENIRQSVKHKFWSITCSMNSVLLSWSRSRRMKSRMVILTVLCKLNENSWLIASWLNCHYSICHFKSWHLLDALTDRIKEIHRTWCEICTWVSWKIHSLLREFN